MLNLTGKPNFRRAAFPASVIAVLLVGLLWKLVLLGQEAFPFNADEAIVGLMGRHILAGARPIFFYGQAYMGALDAYLVAGAFRIFGIEVFTIRLVQIFLYLAIVLTTILIAYGVHRDRVAALLSGLLLAIPTVNFTLYTTVSLGGYGEALLIGNLLILQTLKLRGATPKSGQYLIWGLLVGVGFWSFGLTLIYSIPCAFLLIRGHIKRNFQLSQTPILLILIGLLLGLSPVIIWIGANGVGELVGELFGSALAGSSPNQWLTAILAHLKNFLIFGPTVILGFRPPWSTEALSLTLLPFALGFWSLVLFHMVFRRRLGKSAEGISLLGSVSVLLIMGYILTPFGADPSGRYFLPLMIPLVIMAGEFVQLPTIKIPTLMRWILFLGVFAFQIHATWQMATVQPHRITTQFDAIARIDDRALAPLTSFLASQGEIRGYTNYWVAYPLAFLSEEKIIYYPALPYHEDFRYTLRDNRYAPYQELVESSPSVALITTHHSALDKNLRSSFETLELSWDEKVIGDFRVFFNLSERVDLAFIGASWLPTQP